MQQFGPCVPEGAEAVLQCNRDGPGQREGKLLPGLRCARRD